MTDSETPLNIILCKGCGQKEASIIVSDIAKYGKRNKYDIIPCIDCRCPINNCCRYIYHNNKFCDLHKHCGHLMDIKCPVANCNEKCELTWKITKNSVVTYIINPICKIHSELVNARKNPNALFCQNCNQNYNYYGVGFDIQFNICFYCLIKNNANCNSCENVSNITIDYGTQNIRIEFNRYCKYCYKKYIIKQKQESKRNNDYPSYNSYRYPKMNYSSELYCDRRDQRYRPY